MVSVCFLGPACCWVKPLGGPGGGNVPALMALCPRACPCPALRLLFWLCSSRDRLGRTRVALLKEVSHGDRLWGFKSPCHFQLSLCGRPPSFLPQFLLPATSS